MPFTPSSSASSAFGGDSEVAAAETWPISKLAYGASGSGTRVTAATPMPIGPGSAAAATTGAIVAASTVVGPVTMGTMNGLTVTVSGTHAGVNFGFWGSNDNTLWFPVNAVRTDTGISETTSGVLTANQSRAWDISIGEFLYFRVVATAWTSGSAAIAIQPGMFSSESQVAAIAHAIYNTTLPTFTAGSLAYLLSDVNGRLVVTGQGAAAASIAGAPVRVGGTFTTTLPTYTTGQQTDLQVTARGEVLVALSNGATAVAVKAASTAAATTDPALTVALSPNSPAPATTSANQACANINVNAVGATVTAVKASAGNLFGMSLVNNNAAVVFVSFWNVAVGSVTLGTTVPTCVFAIPASGVLNLPPSALALLNSATAISFAAVTAYNGAAGGSVTGSIFYK